MQKLLMCRGLPASGKSKFAFDLAHEDPSYVIVCKDDLRLELEVTGWKWSPDNEKTVILLRDKRIIEALKSGKNVISADTNLASKHEHNLREIAKQYGAEFEVKDFTDVPVQLCIQRDSQREGKAQVGKGVILKMAKDFKIGGEPLKPIFEPYIPNLDKPTALLCDLDGTLSLMNGRGPFDHDKCDQDIVNYPVLWTLRSFRSSGTKIIFVSGREEKYRDKTLAFLKPIEFDFHPLFMRATGDYRKDWIIKGEIFDREIRDKYNVIFCLDDRNQVVDFYRGLGLTVFQVAPGAF